MTYTWEEGALPWLECLLLPEQPGFSYLPGRNLTVTGFYSGLQEARRGHCCPGVVVGLVACARHSLFSVPQTGNLHLLPFPTGIVTRVIPAFPLPFLARKSHMSHATMPVPA